MSREPYDPIESCAQSLRDIRDSFDALVGALVSPAGVTLDPQPAPDDQTVVWLRAEYETMKAERDQLRARPAPDTALDVERLRGAFIRAGIVWVLPANLFDEAVQTVAREYAALEADHA